MTPATYFSAPVLFDPDGRPASVAGAVIAPGAMSHAAVWQLPGQLHPFRSDESLRDNPENAKAMRRRAFHARLMQERCAQTIVLKWKPVVPNPDDPAQRAVQDALTEAWDAFPDKVTAHEQLLEMVWFGRSGLQVVWDKRANGKPGVVYHEPVHGDSVQFDWAGTPVILVSHQSAQRFEKQFPSSVLPPGEVLPEIVKATDRGAYGLKLNHPALRRRFILSQFRREAADYFDGDMSGRIHGTGLRDRVYWTDQMLVTAEAGMLNFLFSTGMMDLLLFNYITGNEESRKAARDNAEKITGKLALLCPVSKDEYSRRGPVEQIPMNAAGVQALQNVITELYMVQEEHLFVGQSMSTGQGGGGGLEGSGKAEFAESTKTALQKADTDRLATTWTRDWAIPQRDYLFPGSTVPVQMVPIFEDEAGKAKKFDRGVQLVAAGVPVEIEELREAAGFREPRPGKPTIGGATAAVSGPLPPQPGATPDTPNPALPPGKPPAGGPAPNAMLPPGKPAPAAAPNPALPPGRATGKPTPGGVPAAQVSDEDAAAGVAEIVAALNEAFGLTGSPDPAAVLAAVQAGRATGPVGYRLTQAPFAGGVWDEGRHRWVSPQDAPQTAETAPPSPDPAASGNSPAFTADAGPASVLSSLGQEFAAELAGPATAAKASDLFTRAADAVAAVLVRLSPHVLPVLEAILDTTADLTKFGFAPSMGGTASGDMAAAGDPVKAATGVSAHLAAAIASKVLAAAWVKGKRAVGYDADGWPVLYAATHAPAGGVTVGGKEYAGGEFIPAEVMAKATAGERKAVRGRKVAPDVSPVLAHFHKLPADAPARAYIDAAVANASPGDHDAISPPPELDAAHVRKLRKGLASAHRDMHADGKLTDAADRAFVDMMADLGITPLHEPGEVVEFDPETMAIDGPTVSTGTRVRVVRRGWKGLYGSKDVGDRLEGNNYQRADVEPVKG